MAWGSSAIFRAFVTDCVSGATAFDLSGAGVNTFMVTLWDNDITPSKDVTAANSAYGADQWVSAGNEVFEAGQWAQAGVALASPAITNPGAGIVMWDGDNTASGAAADLAAVNGCHVSDDTLTDFGISYHYFGGPNSVVNGTFTIIWHADGLWRITV